MSRSKLPSLHAESPPGVPEREIAVPAFAFAKEDASLILSPSILIAK